MYYLSENWAIEGKYICEFADSFTGSESLSTKCFCDAFCNGWFLCNHQYRHEVIESLFNSIRKKSVWVHLAWVGLTRLSISMTILCGTCISPLVASLRVSIEWFFKLWVKISLLSCGVCRSSAEWTLPILTGGIVLSRKELSPLRVPIFSEVSWVWLS